MMKKKAFGFIFSLVVAVLSLCVCLPKNFATVAAASVENSKQAYFLLDEDVPYESNIQAGTASGYNEYLLGETNIQPIEATANQGFYVAGWRVVFSEVGSSTPVVRSCDGVTIQDNQAVFKSNNFTVTYTADSGSFNVDYTLSFVDEDGDGKAEKSTLITSQIVENVVIDPVFDYIYTNVDVTDLMALTNIESYNRISVSENAEFLYKTKTDLSGASSYSEAILYSDEKYYYFGDVYTENGSVFYTLQERLPKVDDGKTTQKVDVSKGCFRLGASAEFDLTVDAHDDLTTGKNIELQSITANYVDFGDAEVNEQLQATGTKRFSQVKDKFNRTTQFSVNYSIGLNQNHVVTLTSNSHNLYIATIVPQISGAPAGENKSYILGALAIPSNNYHSKIDTERYFVKDPATSGALGFKVTANSVIQNEGYNYYRFESISSSLDGSTTYKNNISIKGSINQNFEITVNYIPFIYKVDFKFALYDESLKLVSPINGQFNVEEEIYLERGETTPVIAKTNASTNIGYTFVGFVNEENTSNLVVNGDDVIGTTTTVTIDLLHPTNKTVYMLFVETEYSLRMNNLNNISLNDGTNTIYPISSMSLNIVRDENTISSYLQDLAKLNVQASFGQTIKLGDKLTVIASINKGFIVYGFGYTKDAKTFDGLTFEISIDQEFLEKYDSASTTFIDMFDFEAYSTYSFTYTLNGSQDNSGQNVLMADISVEYGGVVYNKENIGSSTPNITYVEIGTEKAQIILTNIKLYEKIKLISVAKSYVEGETETYYLFTKFTENSVIYPTIAIDTPNAKAMIHTVVKDNAEVFVVYSMPGLRLSVSIDDASAYDLTECLKNGTTYLLDIENNEKVFFDETTLLANKELIRANAYKLVLDNAFIFGYELKGYNYNGVETLTNSLEFEFTASGDLSQTIEIITNKSEYRLNLFHYMDIESDPFETDSSTFNVGSLNIEFDTIKGYFISQVYFKTATENVRYKAAECDNSYTSSIYSYTFNAEELARVLSSYATTQDAVSTLDIMFVYELHTYEITVKYGFVNSKGVYDSRISYPKITATADGETLYFQDYGEYIVFINIPYGKEIVLTADRVYDEGISPQGWDGYIKQTGYSSTLTQLIIQQGVLTSNQTVQYKLSYNIYNITIERYNNSQDPIVEIRSPIDGSLCEKISRFDRLSIDMNADRKNGWRFVNMYYYRYEYKIYTYSEDTFNSTTLYIVKDNRYVANTEAYDENVTYYTKERVRVDFSAFETYTYSSADWAQIYSTLFVFEGSKYIRNISSKYDENKQYYVYKNTKYLDNEFNIANYLAESDTNNRYSIKFSVVYDYIDISFDVAASLVGSNSLQRGDLNIKPIDYATIAFSKISKSNLETALGELGSISSVSIDDYSVKIVIKLNSIIVDGNTVALSSGVVLRQAFIGDVNLGQIQIEDNGNGIYVLKFLISTMLENNCISQSDSFVIYLRYQISNKNMRLTTNIQAENFYLSRTEGTIFSMSMDETAYNFGSNSISSNGATELSFVGNDSIQFLSKVSITYMFVLTNYSRYFKITDLKIYNLNSAVDSFGFLTYVKGDLIKAYTSDELSCYGITNLSFDNQMFAYRFVEDLFVEMIVEPIINFHAENNRFKVTFDCDKFGNGKEQTLSVGQTAQSNIEMAQMLQQYAVVTYHKNIIQNGINVGYATEGSIPVDAGTYLVKIGFAGVGDWAWLSNLTYGKDIFFVIEPKVMQIAINSSSRLSFEKTYSGKNDYYFSDIDSLLNCIYFTDGNETYSYADANENLRLVHQNIVARISYTNNETQVYSGIATKPNEFHHIHLTGLEIANSNFKLSSDNLLFENVMKVNKKEITLEGVSVYDKVYDGTDKAEYKVDSQLKWVGVLAGDIVSAPNVADLSLKFATQADGTVKIGYNVEVLIDASKVLKGIDSDNYAIKVNGTTANIYPYSVSTNVSGYGIIEVRNEKGLIDTVNGTNHDLASLIPIGAELKVEVVRIDTPEFVALYPKISRYLNRNHTFVVAYKISFINNNITTNLSNNLTLVLPTVPRLTNALMLNNSSSIQLEYTLDNDSLVIDLSQTNYEPFTFALIQQRVLLKPWQLILIISLAVLLLLIIIIVFVIVRKRKKERYSLNEKI